MVKKKEAMVLGYNKAGLEMGGRGILPCVGGMISGVIGFIGFPFLLGSIPVGLIMIVGGFTGAYFCFKKASDIQKEYN